jgi:hypothetical protein
LAFDEICCLKAVKIAMIVVQHIETTWYKNERGATHGTLRDKTPTAALIPVESVTVNHNETIVHTIQYARTTSERREQISIRTGKNLQIERLHVETSESRAFVNFTWDYQAGGKPTRWQLGRKTWTLKNNEWGRIRYNGRLVLEHTWQYKIMTINIGVFDQLIQDCFETTLPNYSIENMVQLR